MSDIVERLRHWMPIDLEDARWMRNAAADRIEALEKHKRLQTEDVMNLGAQLGQACLRVERLEAALRAIIIRCEEGDKKSDWLPTISNIARAAIAQSSPPARQENDDVYPGFRGNNEA